MIASIDTGSNTIRFLIGFFSNNRIERVYSDRKITRLGESIKTMGMIKESRMRESIECLRGFKAKAIEFGVNKISAVGTSALREARNSHEFLKMVKEEVGIDIRVISEEEEAFLTIEGIRSGFELPDEFIAFDLGGGSTEFIIGRAGSLDMLSIPMGVLKLSHLIENYPPSAEIVSGISSEIKRSLLSQGLQNLSSCIRPQILIGTGGTVTTLASLDLALDKYEPERIHGHRLSLSGLKDVLKRLLGLTLGQIRELKGIEKGREDIILAGLLSVIEIMELFSKETLTVSDFGILEGIIKYEAQVFFSNRY